MTPYQSHITLSQNIDPCATLCRIHLEEPGRRGYRLGANPRLPVHHLQRPLDQHGCNSGGPSRGAVVDAPHDDRPPAVVQTCSPREEERAHVEGPESDRRSGAGLGHFGRLLGVAHHHKVEISTKLRRKAGRQQRLAQPRGDHFVQHAAPSMSRAEGG